MVASLCSRESRKGGDTVNVRPEHEIIPEEEINLYDCWKVLVKRKKILIGIFLVPLVIATIVSLSLPRYYRGESEISIPALPASNILPVITAPNIVRLIGDIDDSQKVKIFTKNPDAIQSVLISLPKISTDKINIIVEAKTADVIPQAFKEILDYVNNLPEIKEENTRIKAENDLKLENLIEAKKANLFFLNQITNMIKKGQVSVVNVNPSDLIEKDANLSLQIKNLQMRKVAVGKLAPPSITRQPSTSRIKQIIMITGLLSLFTGIFVIFLLEYIDRMKAREK
jgi:capsular polysaccharide biosynthesis protein